MKNNLRSEISKISFEFVEDVVKMSMSNRINKTYYISKFSKKILALIKKHERENKIRCTTGCTRCINFMADIHRSGKMDDSGKDPNGPKEVEK